MDTRLGSAAAPIDPRSVLRCVSQIDASDDHQVTSAFRWGDRSAARAITTVAVSDEWQEARRTEAADEIGRPCGVRVANKERAGRLSAEADDDRAVRSLVADERTDSGSTRSKSEDQVRGTRRVRVSKKEEPVRRAVETDRVNSVAVPVARDRHPPCPVRSEICSGHDSTSASLRFRPSSRQSGSPPAGHM